MRSLRKQALASLLTALTLGVSFGSAAVASCIPMTDPHDRTNALKDIDPFFDAVRGHLSIDEMRDIYLRTENVSYFQCSNQRIVQVEPKPATNGVLVFGVVTRIALHNQRPGILGVWMDGQKYPWPF